jgi:prophage regulatory protein
MQQLPARGIRVKRVAEILGTSVPTVWRWSKENPNFPKKRNPSPRVSIWIEDEIVAFRDSSVSEVGGLQ